MNAGQLTTQLLELADELRDAEEEARNTVTRWVNAERAYKRRQSLARLEITEYRNADERDAQAELIKWQDGQTLSDLRAEAHAAEEGVHIAKEVMRNRRQELSALQTLGNLARQELMFHQTAPIEALGA